VEIYVKEHDDFKKIQRNGFTKINKEKGKNKISQHESILQELLFKNPQIISETIGITQFIPLLREFNIKNHGRIDILATDDEGHIYIIECKLSNNPDGKSIRGQLTDYIAGIWSQCNKTKNKDEKKFGEFWKYLCDEIKTSKFGKKEKLEDILNKKQKSNSADDIKKNMQFNFRDNNMIGIFAVDEATSSIKERVDYHNSDNSKKKCPLLVLEIQKHLHKKKEIISVQSYPDNFQEISGIIQKSYDRTTNDYETWLKKLQQENPPRQKKIINFVNDLKKMTENNKGHMLWGSGIKTPSALPRFHDFPDRSPIRIHSSGKCTFQYGMMMGVHEYQNATLKFKKRIKEIQGFDVGDRPRQPLPIEPEIWIPHAKEILESLEVFTRKEFSDN